MLRLHLMETCRRPQTRNLHHWDESTTREVKCAAWANIPKGSDVSISVVLCREQVSDRSVSAAQIGRVSINRLASTRQSFCYRRCVLLTPLRLVVWNCSIIHWINEVKVPTIGQVKCVAICPSRVTRDCGHTTPSRPLGGIECMARRFINISTPFSNPNL